MATRSSDKKKPVKRPTAVKRMLQNEKKRLRNKSFCSKIRTAVRRYEDSLKQTDALVAKESLDAVYSLLDKAVKKGVYKLNKASRTKARLTHRLNKAV
ncbi:MAG: rpsT [Chlamydiales bacterium]|jgi:small subunit ribosomal protein S20|nr:rpsT [Chlamydiales bacterium]